MTRKARTVFSTLVFAALLAVLAMVPPRASHGGSAIVVNTTEIGAGTFGNCALDEAINAANLGALVDNCNGEDTDTIEFNLGTGTPVINVTTLLPVINAPVTINGNSGGATRVELHGFGGTGSSDDGLKIADAADGTVIRNLVINNFGGSGIYVSADNVTVTGSFIGTNAAGDTAAGNVTGAGITVGGLGAKIGGTSGTTPSGPCTGDCNLISANSFGGIFIAEEGAGAIVQGNFLGTDVTGEEAIPNNSWGVFAAAPFTMIGGTSAAARNVASGNNGSGVRVQGASNIQGNYIGTNAAGDAALPNREGIYVLDGGDGSQVGGTSPGAGNLVSGNANYGFKVDGASNVDILGNRIGTAANGTSPLGNGSTGLWFYNGSSNNVVGGIAAGEGNVIAFNGNPGVEVSGDPDPTNGNAIRGNSIHDNDGPPGIENHDGGNLELAPPVINSVGVLVAGNGVSGTACANCEVDVYSDDEDEGRVYEGTVTASGTGDWTFDANVTGPNVTATANDAAGNTSMFSEPFTVPAETPTPSPSPTPSPTPTGGPTLVQGDVNCSGGVDLDDFVFLIEYAAGVNDGTTPGDCPDVGGALPAGGVSNLWGDVDCSDVVDARDALAVLAWPDFELPHPGCEDIGHPLA